jgi:asparagine synthase (glutamine-hydrolysing)
MSKEREPASGALEGARTASGGLPKSGATAGIVGRPNARWRQCSGYYAGKTSKPSPANWAWRRAKRKLLLHELHKSMCGIAGFVDFRLRTPEVALRQIARAMANTLRHRGPDDEGVWADAAAGIALAHRRLSILDLSGAGHQPMVSESGRYVITYNGEIYNTTDLRSALDHSVGGAPRFRGHSDTEIMLGCVERWGVEESLGRWNGMFAFALWDRVERELFLARDRLGEKPLYYAWTCSGLLFASELKALRAHPEFDSEIDREAVALFLRYNCIPAPRTIYRRAYKLPPATLLRITHSSRANARPRPYWSLAEVVAQGRENPFTGTAEEACEQLEALLDDAVGIRMAADVPVGIFLSGGIDSSTVAAMAQGHGGGQARSFSIGLEDSGYDESSAAAEVARHLGTEHCALLVTHDEAEAVIPHLASVYDEPFADSSQIPTLLLSGLTRRHVTVALSGDGGDEVFGGYNRHVWAKRVGRLIDGVPLQARRAAAGAIRKIPEHTWNRCFRFAGPVLPGFMRHRTPGYKLHKLAGILTASDLENVYRHFVSHWSDPAQILQDPPERDERQDCESGYSDFSFEEEMMYRDSVTYLPDDILVKVDRATMAASLESRAPFLDPRIVEFAWRLPLCRKIANGQGKRILREVLYRHVPRTLVERPKSGFGIPLGGWLRGPLRNWAEDLLDDRRLSQEGYFRAEPIRTMWQQHLSGNGAWEFHLWDILMFEMWLGENSRIPPHECETAGAPLAS